MQIGITACCCLDIPGPILQRWNSDAPMGSYPTLAGFAPNNVASNYGGSIARNEWAFIGDMKTWRRLSGDGVQDVLCYKASRATVNDYTGLGVWYMDRFGSFKTVGKMQIYYPAFGYIGIFNNGDYLAGGSLGLSSSYSIAPASGTPEEVLPDALVAASGKFASSVAVFFFGITSSSDLPTTIPNAFLGGFNFP